MADTAEIHIGENSPEYVAYRLLTTIAANEGKKIYGGPTSGGGYADGKWLLDTYAECLRTVKDPFSRLPPIDKFGQTLGEGNHIVASAPLHDFRRQLEAA